MAGGQRGPIEQDIKALPKKISADELSRVHRELKRDLEKLQKRRSLTQQSIERVLHSKHKKLSYGQPSIFFKTVRGELDDNMFKTMDVKRRVESGEIDDRRARELVIDSAKEMIANYPNRVKKPAPEGSTVQEITMKCKVED